MIRTGTLDIGKGENSLPPINRWTPWQVDIDFVGVDLTGATFRAQWRAFRDGPAALIDLTNSTAPAEGISVSVATVEGVTTSTVQMRINETTIEGLPFTNPKGGNPDLVWDLHITSGGSKKRWLQGASPIHAGSTQ